MTKSGTEKIQGNLTTIIDPSKKKTSSNKVKVLEGKLEFADTYLNRVNLADAYLASNNFSEAIVHYNKALEDRTQNDFYVDTGLVKSHYYSKNYEEVIATSELLENHKEFEKSDIPFMYGMALAEKGRNDEAELQLRRIDRPYSNYNERLALAEFLLKLEKTKDAKEILEELYVETQNMTPINRQVFKTTITAIEKLKNSL